MRFLPSIWILAKTLEAGLGKTTRPGDVTDEFVLLGVTAAAREGDCGIAAFRLWPLPADFGTDLLGEPIWVAVSDGGRT